MSTTQEKMQQGTAVIMLRYLLPSSTTFSAAAVFSHRHSRCSETEGSYNYGCRPDANRQWRHRKTQEFADPKKIFGNFFARIFLYVRLYVGAVSANSLAFATTKTATNYIFATICLYT